MQRVHPLGPVERDVGDVVALLVFDEFKIHFFHLPFIRSPFPLGKGLGVRLLALFYCSSNNSKKASMLCISCRRICTRVPSIRCIVTRPLVPSARLTPASSTPATLPGAKMRIPYTSDPRCDDPFTRVSLRAIGVSLVHIRCSIAYR